MFERYKKHSEQKCCDVAFFFNSLGHFDYKHEYYLVVLLICIYAVMEHHYVQYGYFVERCNVQKLLFGVDFIPGSLYFKFLDKHTIS